METIDFIKEHLAIIGEDYDSLKPFMQEWILKVTLIIQEITAEQTNAEIILRETDYSIKKIADKSGASRTTFYNHGQLLKKYIEHVSQISLNTNPYEKIETLQSEKRLLQEQISKMMQRDVDIELLKVENRNLSSTLAAKNEDIKRLEKHVLNLNSKFTKQKATITHKSN